MAIRDRRQASLIGLWDLTQRCLRRKEVLRKGAGLTSQERKEAPSLPSENLDPGAGSKVGIGGNVHETVGEGEGVQPV